MWMGLRSDCGQTPPKPNERGKPNRTKSHCHSCAFRVAFCSGWAVGLQVGCADAAEAERIVLRMIEKRELLATINQQDGMVCAASRASASTSLRRFGINIMC